MCPDHERALKCALAYRRIGLSPLPSREDDKRPTLTEYSQYRTEPIPDDVYTPQGWTTPNVQIMTGVRHAGALKVLAVDLDGSEARVAFRRMCKSYGLESRKLWITRSPSGGRHVYFTIPDGLEKVCTRMIWGIATTFGRSGKPEWVKHNEIKILGDGALAVAPPSIHVDFRASKERYCFETGHSPKDFQKPMTAPDWLLNMPAYELPKEIMPRRERRDFAGPLDNITDFDVIQDSIPPDQKMAIAEEWGLIFSGRENGGHWIVCHSIDGSDETPSAGFQSSTGRYKDFRSGNLLSFFQLGVALGKFASTVECAKWCSCGHVTSSFRQS